MIELAGNRKPFSAPLPGQKALSHERELIQGLPRKWPGGRTITWYVPSLGDALPVVGLRKDVSVPQHIELYVIFLSIFQTAKKTDVSDAIVASVVRNNCYLKNRRSASSEKKIVSKLYGKSF